MTETLMAEPLNNRTGTRRFGLLLALAVGLYIGAVIAFIIFY
jgi:hypothetical protein